MAADGAGGGAAAAAAAVGSSDATMDIHAAHEWFARRSRAAEPTREALLAGLKTAAAGIIPLGGRTPMPTTTKATTTALTTTKVPAEDPFFALLLASAALPASLPRAQQRAALERFFVEQHKMTLPVASERRDDDRADKTKDKPQPGDDSAELIAREGDGGRERRLWGSVHRARGLYFAARRAFFLARIELFRLVLESPARHRNGAGARGSATAPAVAVAEEVTAALTRDGLVAALLDELHGRLSIQAPNLYASLPPELLSGGGGGGGAASTGAVSPWSSRQIRVAQQQWEMQFLEEERLLRELALLTMTYASERLGLPMILETVEGLLEWPSRVLPEALSQSAAQSSACQRQCRRIDALSALLSVRLLHQLSEDLDGLQGPDERRRLGEWTHGTLLSERWRLAVEAPFDALIETLDVSGVVLVAWSALVAKRYRRERTPALQDELQEVVHAAEHLRGLQRLREALRLLILDQEGDEVFPLLPRADRNHATTATHRTWGLPEATGATPEEPLPSRVAVFQLVGAAFLDDALAALGYTEDLEDADPAQLEAMAKLVAPVLAHSDVADEILATRTSAAVSSSSSGLVLPPHEYGSALRELLAACHGAWPAHPLPGLRLYTSLCRGRQSRPTEAPSVRLPATRTPVQFALKAFSTPRAMASDSASAASWRPLPPDDYLAYETATRVKCIRAFAYEADGVGIPAGTIGELQLNDDVDDDQGALVRWANVPGAASRSLWDALLGAFQGLVERIQVHPRLLVGALAAEDEPTRGVDDEMVILTAFFEWTAAVTRTGTSTTLSDLAEQWALARLRQWWRDQRLPDPDRLPGRLIRANVSLTLLQTATREDLVAWGIPDRYTRERILACIAAPSTAASVAAHQQLRLAQTRSALVRDGLGHLLRMLLGFLDAFVHAPVQGRDEDMEILEDPELASHTAQRANHFVTAALSMLNVLTTSPIGVEILLAELGGVTNECVTLVLQSARRLFETHESGTGTYPGIYATMSTLLNVVRWCMGTEAVRLSVPATDSVSSAISEAELREAEHHWLTGTVEFVLEVLATHETWKFTALTEKWALLERGFRLLTALLTPKFESTGVLQNLSAALQETITQDLPLMMKLLRSCGRLLSKHGSGTSLGHVPSDAIDDDRDSDVFIRGTSREHAEMTLFPLEFVSEVDGSTALRGQEALVTSALRLVEALLSRSSPAAALSLLQQRIDGDTVAVSELDHNLVSLCAGYLSYPVSRAPSIASWSIQILTLAALVMQPNPRVSLTPAFPSIAAVNHSLVALFREQDDLEHIRDSVFGLIRASEGDDRLRNSLLVFLTQCLDHQPSFFAILFVSNDTSGSTMKDRMQGLVTMIDRLLRSSEQLLEQSTEVLCRLLVFLRQVWRGAIQDGKTIHRQLADALRESPKFWYNVTRPLCVRLPLRLDSDQEEDDSMDPSYAENDVRDPSPKTGRSSALGHVVRGVILELLAFEWHAHGRQALALGSTKDTHLSLLAVLDSFRDEGLYAHWLRTFTQLQHNVTPFVAAAASVHAYCLPVPAAALQHDFKSATNDASSGEVSVLAHNDHATKLQGTLDWQLASIAAYEPTAKTIEARVRWCQEKMSGVAGQLFALARWKAFMELYALQLAKPESESEPQTPTLSGRGKRKESMIASPPRVSRRLSASTLPSSPMHSASGPMSIGSNFFGDRTSFGMIQVLSDVLASHQRDQERRMARGGGCMDIFTLRHIYAVVDLLVSMLHHQLCVVLRKTRDPKHSQTRQREHRVATMRLTIAKSVDLLILIEKTTRHVIDALQKLAAPEDSGPMNTEGRATDTETTMALSCQLVESASSELATLACDLRISLLTAALLLTRHISSHVRSSDPVRGLTPEVTHRAGVNQVQWIGHTMEATQWCDRMTGPDAMTSVSTLFDISSSLFHELLDDYNVVTSGYKQKIPLDAGVMMRPLIMLLRNETRGLRALFDMVLRRFQRQLDTTEVLARQRQALSVLEGVAAIIWNPSNAELCRLVMVSDSIGFSVVRFLASEFLPTLYKASDTEVSIVGVGNRGYCRRGEGASLERSMVHRAWCRALSIVAGLLPHISPQQEAHSGIWDFVAEAECFIAPALRPSLRITRALAEEQQAILTFLNALSSTPGRRKQWRQMFPKNHVVLMEQSRLALRRACVLLGSSSFTAARKNEQQQQLQLPKRARRLSVTSWPLTAPRSPSSSSSTYAHQTLLHEHLMPTTDLERRQLSAFYRDIERELVVVVEQAALLLTKWTSSVASASATVSVHGARYVDTEQLIPLLELISPGDSLTMSCEPSLGQLCVAMEFLVEELKTSSGASPSAAVSSGSAAFARKPEELQALAASALNACGLLFFKTYLVHAELAEENAWERVQAEFKTFFDDLKDQLELLSTPLDGRGPDVTFFTIIQQVIQAGPAPQ